MTDENRCMRCEWTEQGEDVNPHRQKCPECGAAFVGRYERRMFGEDGDGDG